MKKKYFLYTFILATFLFISGCTLWSNFTTYFNLYYNIDKLFTDAEKIIGEQQTELFPVRETPVPGNATQMLVKVIEKCSRLLQFHSKSSYVDNALLLIGKSFYYQQNYQQAMQKFRELIATQPNSSFILESQLWIGKTDLRLRNFSSGIDILRTVRESAIEKNEEDIAVATYIEEIRYHLLMENYNQSISLAEELLNISSDRTKNAEIVYETGLMYIKIKDYESAAAAFKNVERYSPSFDIEFKSSLEYARVIRELDRDEESLAVLKSMRSEDKNFDNYNILDMEIGISLYDLHLYEDAFHHFTIVDTTYKNNIVSGVALYHLGLIMEVFEADYDSALVYFRKAQTAQAPQEYSLKSQGKVRVYNNYFNYHTALKDLKQPLFYAEFPEEFEKDSIAFYKKFEVIPDTLDTLSVDETSIAEFDEFGEEKKEEEIQIALEDGKTPPRPPVRPVLTLDSLKTLYARNIFDIGNIFLNDFHHLDSAYYYYQTIVQSFNNTTYYPRTLYRLGLYYLETGNKVKADSLFLVVYDNFKTEAIVNAAADKIGKPFIDLYFDPASELYAEAEQTFFNKDFNTSYDLFWNVYRTFPASPLAPKALYAGGWILENEFFLLDSAVTVYDSLLQKYPATSYANEVRKRVTEYRLEKSRRQQAILDSIRAVEDMRMKDSLLKISREQDQLQVEEEKKNKEEIIEKKEEEEITPDNDLLKEEED